MGKDILVFILSTTLLITLFTFNLILSLSNFLTVDSITNTLKKSDFTQFYDKNNTQIMNAFTQVLEKSNIPTELTTDIVNSDQTKEFMGTFIGKSIENVINGKEEKPLSEKDVVKLVDGNMYIVEDYSKKKGFPLNEQAKKEILTLSEENAQLLINKMPSTNEILAKSGNDKINELTELSRILLSKDTKKGFLIIIGINILFLILLRLKKFRWLKTLSAPIMITSFLLLVISLALKQTIINFINSLSGLINTIFSPIMDSLLNIIFKYGIFMLFISLALLLVYNIQKKVLKNE